MSRKFHRAGALSIDDVRWMDRESSRDNREQIEKLLATEQDRRIQIWIRVRLAGERLVDVAERWDIRMAVEFCK